MTIGPRWKKLGRLFKPNSTHPKLHTHAANPLAIPIERNIYRVFFSGRDKQNRSSIGAVDIDLIERKVVQTFKEPFFLHGPENSFFEHGVSIGNCYKTRNGRFILFMGWQNPDGEHWRGEVGRLILLPDLTLRTESSTPFIALNSDDSTSLSYPWVLRTNDDQYDMWYGSTTSWTTDNGEMLHLIKHASSREGEHWIRSGVAIPYELGIAQAFSRPTVIGNMEDGFHMWFSFRGGPETRYRIGYANSENGLDWEVHLNFMGMDVSTDGWDSEMVEYPFVFDHMNERYMLYNGNGYGKTGFGLAILEP